MKEVRAGLDILAKDNELQKELKGNVALFCHNASSVSAYTHAIFKF